MHDANDFHASPNRPVKDEHLFKSPDVPNAKSRQVHIRQLVRLVPTRVIAKQIKGLVSGIREANRTGGADFLNVYGEAIEVFNSLRPNQPDRVWAEGSLFALGLMSLPDPLPQFSPILERQLTGQGHLPTLPRRSDCGFPGISFFGQPE